MNEMVQFSTRFLLLLILLLSLFLFSPTTLAQTANCTFPNGQVAENYEPCNPDQAETSCCLRGEACLSSGLCYGALGLVYRGGCSGGWLSAACPRYCLDSIEGHANFLTCGSDTSWWCGNGNSCTTDDGTLVSNLLPGNVIRIAGSDTLTTAVTTTSTTTVIASVTGSAASATKQQPASTPTFEANGGNCSDQTGSTNNDNHNNTTVVGAAVGGSLGGAACICGTLGVFFFRERKKRKEMERQLQQQQQQLQQQAQAQIWAYNQLHNQPPGYPAEAGGQPHTVELDTQRTLYELGNRKSSYTYMTGQRNTTAGSFI
ncbi:hypothetical protein VTN77DRAFT_5772 [Rasamsonia byssochlamydoides]|uniref:uncharacterized protein n=1 Tax=Rasamsonia byssochlamydoides TaxID=89139 RepID=UPI003743853A